MAGVQLPAQVTEAEVDAFAFCADGRCYGYKQTPVKGIRTITEFLNGTLDGAGAVAAGHPERSTMSVRFVDEGADGPCPECGKARHISEQERPEYAPQSGQPQDALLNLGKTQAQVKDLEHANQLSDLRHAQEMKELREQIDRLTVAVEKRGPGRPPKAAE